jgi:hypothetical protein
MKESQYFENLNETKFNTALKKVGKKAKDFWNGKVSREEAKNVIKNNGKRTGKRDMVKRISDRSKIGAIQRRNKIVNRSIVGVGAAGVAGTGYGIKKHSNKKKNKDMKESQYFENFENLYEEKTGERQRYDNAKKGDVKKAVGAAAGAGAVGYVAGRKIATTGAIKRLIKKHGIKSAEELTSNPSHMAKITKVRKYGKYTGAALAATGAVAARNAYKKDLRKKAEKSQNKNKDMKESQYFENFEELFEATKERQKYQKSKNNNKGKRIASGFVGANVGAGVGYAGGVAAGTHRFNKLVSKGVHHETANRKGNYLVKGLTAAGALAGTGAGVKARKAYENKLKKKAEKSQKNTNESQYFEDYDELANLMEEVRSL